MVDVTAAICLGVLTLPVQGAVACAIRVKLGKPVLFRQERPGLHGRPFRLVKFRTMSDLTDAEGQLLPDEERVTRLGQFLRSTSLDELPELYNVVKGEMSLVGPRPLLMQYLEHYDEFEARRHDVRPGITGLAQVQGRNQTSWQGRFELDNVYVSDASFLLDARIVVQTLKAVVARTGVYNANLGPYERQKEID